VGTATAAPDLAHVTVGVVTEDRRAQAALAANSAAVAQLLATLKELSIAERDIQTRGFNLSPVYDQQRQGRGGAPTIVGYRVQNEVAVRVRALARLGALLDRVVADGANQVHGIAFALAEPATLEEAARRAAIADAKRRAETYAAAAGVAVGQVLAIAESNAVEVPRPLQRLMAAESAGGQVPVAEGEIEVRAAVSVTYAIAP